MRWWWRRRIRFGGRPAGLARCPGTVDAPRSKFLPASAYADLFAIDAHFPFGVVARHAADADIVGSHWDRGTGPEVTLGVYGSDAEPAVIEWTIPSSATAGATSHAISFTEATGLPQTFYYGADGMVDLPFGSASLLDYTGASAPYPGEALLYSADYQQVVSRADVNGFYSGVGVTDGTKNVLVYSGLSALGSGLSATNDNGLYAATLCGGKLVGAGCTSSSSAGDATILLCGFTSAAGDSDDSPMRAIATRSSPSRAMARGLLYRGR